MVEIDPNNTAKASVKIIETTLKTFRTNAKFIVNSEPLIKDKNGVKKDTIFLFGGTP